MKIVLTGFMGSGKSTVASILGKMLELPVIEMDDEIVKLSERESIPEIFQLDGESTFRNLESQVALSVAPQTDVIISTGGGAVGSEQNLGAFKKNNGKIIYLKTGFETIKARIDALEDRPLFADVEAARNLYEKRESLYTEVADIVVATDDLSAHDVATQIQQLAGGADV